MKTEIQIPDWLAQSIIYGGYGLVFLCAALVLIAIASVAVVKIMKYSGVYTMSVLWLLYRKGRRDYLHQLNVAVDHLRTEESDYYYSLRRQFNEPTEEEKLKNTPNQ